MKAALYYTGPRQLTQAHPGDGGFDLYAVSNHINDYGPSILVRPFETVKVYTGMHVSIPHGYVGIVSERSGYPFKNIPLTVKGGIIDSNYRGEIVVLIQNTSDKLMSLDPTRAIAQLVIVKLMDADVVRITRESFERRAADQDVLEHSFRGTNGFGSSDSREAPE